ncbi:hypothetical protein [Kitasatospora sp. NPDC087314]|uniref:hypothetical protein n=1 Tax=Kitasatospora sp. NPDC087314 TaxID=3364068 RepID=UPI0037F4EBE4
MYTVTTLRADTPQQLIDRLVPLAVAEFLAGRAGRLSPLQANTPQQQADLWLLAVARPSLDPGEWVVYGLTSDADIPGWPDRLSYYTGGIRDPRQVAQAFAAAGLDIVMRHYTTFGATCTDQAVPLT